MDTSTDVNTILANAARTFENKAAMHRTAAAEALEGLSDPLVSSDRAAPARIRQEAERLGAIATVWQERAASAKSGMLLFGKSEYEDAGFTNEFRDLVSTCRNAGRMIYARPIDSALDVAKPGV